MSVSSYHRRPVHRHRLLLATLGFLLAAAAGGCGAGRRSDGDTAVRDLLPELAVAVVEVDRVDVGHAGCSFLLGAGWHPEERTPAGLTYAWTAATAARLTLLASGPTAGVLRLRGYGLADPRGGRRCELLVNGYSLGEQPMRTRPGCQEWTVPAHRLRAGANEVEIRVDRTVSPHELGLSGDRRPLGLLVDGLEFVPRGARAVDLPYDETASGALGPGRRLFARLAHPAGSTLSVAWAAGGAAPRARIVGAPGGQALEEFSTSAGDTQLVATLPATLPDGVWLEIGGGSGRLTAAEIARERVPLDVVLIVVDTLRPDYLGCYGGGATPAVDGLAADGTLFAAAFCQTPITGPSHTSLFTSRLPSETGVLNNARGTIPAGMPTLAEILAESGWRARAAVAIGNVRSIYGFDRGFADYADRMDGGWLLTAEVVGPRIEAQRRALDRPGLLFAHYADPHEPYDAHGTVERAAEVLVDGEVRAVIPTSTYTPTRLPLSLPAGRTVVTIRSHDRFHVRSLGLRPGTSGAVLAAEYDGYRAVTEQELAIVCGAAGQADLMIHIADRIDGAEALRARYALEVTHTDAWVGTLLDSLRAEGRYDESLIIFTGDHGESLGEHGHVGHVENLHDPMTRVPLIIKPPRSWGLPAGRRRTDVAALTDLLPTVLAAAGLPPLPGARGRDLLADGADKSEGFAFAETHRPEAQRDLYGLRTAAGRIVYEPEHDAWEYYDLTADPGETVNAAREDDPGFNHHRRLLLGVLAELDLSTAREQSGVVVDERTAEMLRSLGY